MPRGTYYDPKEIFCGKYDCYKILGFDFESWGRNPPSTKNITQSYRSMSRQWHPDKNKDKGATDRFLKINKAYSVLTDSTLRKEYDYFRDRPDEYYYKYGSDVLYKYAPKSDVVVVVAIILLFSCIISWFAQKKKWQQVCERLINDALEDLQMHEGGSKQSMEVRREAEEILKKTKETGETNTNGVDNGYQNGKLPSKKVRLTKKELKDKEKEELKPIIQELVYKIRDFGAGFHHPTWRDILVVRMVYNWPVSFVKALMWETRYYYRRLRKFELNDEEKSVLTERAVGSVLWSTASPEEKNEMLEGQLWILENLIEWKEVRQMSPGDQRRFNRSKKKNKGISDELKSD
jgi:DnaJ family protein C protein 25